MKKRVVILGLILLAVTAVAVAKRLYQYRDENGIVHYSDTPPKTDQPVESRLIKVDPQPRLTLRKKSLADSATEYWLFNHFHGPQQVELRFTEATNVHASPSLPARIVLPNQGDFKVLTVAQADRTRAMSYRLSYRGVPGDPDTRPDSDFLYWPPFQAGQRHPITQGFNGEFSHNDADSRYAVDIYMPIGTPVLAARDGVVMDIDEDFYGSGTDLNKYGARANKVYVLHADGTMAVYAHLKLESIVVAAGQAVLAGEQLAESGNTGFSSGPHLHFAIQRNAGMQLVSVPFHFRGTDGQAVTPKRGLILRGLQARLQ